METDPPSFFSLSLLSFSFCIIHNHHTSNYFPIHLHVNIILVQTPIRKLPVRIYFSHNTSVQHILGFSTSNALIVTIFEIDSPPLPELFLLAQLDLCGYNFALSGLFQVSYY